MGIRGSPLRLHLLPFHFREIVISDFVMCRGNSLNHFLVRAISKITVSQETPCDVSGTDNPFRMQLE